MIQEFVQQIKSLTEEMISRVHTAVPGRIENIDYETGTADVKPLALMMLSEDDEDYIQYPLITDVPIMFPQGAGQNVSITYPVKKGDYCLLVFAEQSLDLWRYGTETESDLTFDLTNAICIPGLFQKAPDDLKEANSDNSLIFRNGDTYLKINEKTVEIIGDLEVSGTINGGSTLSLGTYIVSATLTNSGGLIQFSIPTGRVFPSGTTISKITFNIVGRAANANGVGYYIIKSASGGTDKVAFDSSATKTFYNANNDAKSLTSSLWTSKTIEGGTNIYIAINGGTDFFSGNSTIRNYINNQPCVLYLDNITVTLSS